MFIYWVSFCLTATILLHMDGPVFAEWVALHDQYQSHPLQTAYIDPATVHREGNLVEVSTLIDWKAMQGGRTPTRFYSTQLAKQLNCQERRVRTLSATDFYGHMGTGEIIGGGSYPSEGHWVAIEPGTINDGFLQAACRKK